MEALLTNYVCLISTQQFNKRFRARQSVRHREGFKIGRDSLFLKEPPPQLPPPLSLLCTSSSPTYKALPYELLLFIGCLGPSKLKGPKETNLEVPEKVAEQYSAV